MRSPTVAVVRLPSPRLDECELTFIDRDPIDVALATDQHAAYCRTLEACGARVERLAASDEFPDSVFVEDTALVLDEIAILTMPGAASRRGEVPAIREVLAGYRPVDPIQLPATLDGGDVLRTGRRLYVGLSSRTNPAGFEALRHKLQPYGYEAGAVEVKGSLHLKTACTALDDDTLLLNPAWIDASLFGDKRILPVDPAEPWAANVLRIGDTVLMNAACPRTMARAAEAGFSVRGVEISEFSKAEAGLTCLSLLFDG